MLFLRWHKLGSFFFSFCVKHSSLISNIKKTKQHLHIQESSKKSIPRERNVLCLIDNKVKNTARKIFFCIHKSDICRKTDHNTRQKRKRIMLFRQRRDRKRKERNKYNTNHFSKNYANVEISAIKQASKWKKNINTTQRRTMK